MNDVQKAIISSLVVICITAWYIVLALALPAMIQFYFVMVYGVVFATAAKFVLYACAIMWAAAGISATYKQREAILEGD